MKDASGSLVQIIPQANVAVPSYTGATSSAAGTAGLVPAAQSSEREKYLRGDGTWQEITEGEAPYFLTALDPETDQSGTLDDVSGVIFYVPDLNSNQNAEPSEPSEP